ncbi:hypothetical protein LTR28_010715, partial [Elasticomyces elasticus]
MANSRKREREQPVDWDEYFGGEIPKEIIVIDDDESPASSSKHTHTDRTTQPAKPEMTNGSARQAEKRRKTGPSNAYDPVYHQNASYSNTQTPYYDEDSSRKDKYSTDRTASAYTTTAPTSLGSQASTGAHLPATEQAAAGQKRKRQTRQDTADTKRRQVDAQPDPLASYVPPPQPPLKAKDVFVQVVHDRSAQKNDKCDDDDGHYIVMENADLSDRYSIVKLLGQGTFGKVVKAWDRKKQTDCAIKIIRSVQKYRDASRIELRVLSTLAQNDKHNRNKCIHLRDTFDFRNHICIVTDLLGQSVFDFLKSNQFVPFPSSHIQGFARQLFTSVAFLHDLNLIHTDLKPENILLVSNAYQTFTYNRTIPSSSTTTSRTSKYRKVLLDPEIRLIDFGSATFDDEYHSTVVSTRHYRAPEIILNLGWSFPCDIWSIGCILVEFFTGDALFQTHDNLEHLAMMEAICGGSIEKSLVRLVTGSRGSNRNSASGPPPSFFKRGHVLDYPQPETPRQSKKYVKAMKHIHETIPPTTPFNRAFIDLLKKIFVYDPKRRITAKQALQHP